MGERKCEADEPLSSSPPSPHSDLPCPAGTDAVISPEKSRLPIDASLSMASVTGIPAKKPNFHFSLDHHRSGASRGIFLKRSRRAYGYYSSRRNSAGHHTGSSSHNKGTTLLDERHRKGKHPTDGNGMEKMVFLTDPTNLDCGICNENLSEYDIVAVLICGHVYHAEKCLGRSTRLNDIRDPPCPMCLKLISKAKAA
ncbi:hypothetical protein Dimus_034314 [Dionaea muscipula]